MKPILVIDEKYGERILDCDSISDIMKLNKSNIFENDEMPFLPDQHFDYYIRICNTHAYPIDLLFGNESDRDNVFEYIKKQLGINFSYPVNNAE